MYYSSIIKYWTETCWIHIGFYLFVFSMQNEKVMHPGLFHFYFENSGFLIILFQTKVLYVIVNLFKEKIMLKLYQCSTAEYRNLHLNMAGFRLTEH